jgi:hypothetical protein
VRIGIRRIEIDRLAEKPQRLLAETAIVENLREEEMEHGRIRVLDQGAPELALGRIETSRRFFRDPAFHQQSEVIGRFGEPLPKLGNSSLEKARLAERNLEIAARDAHAFIERERTRKRRNRLVEHAATIVEVAEVVLCPRIRRIDATSERPENLRISR